MECDVCNGGRQRMDVMACGLSVRFTCFLTGGCDRRSGQRQKKSGWHSTPERESYQSAGCDDHRGSHSDVNNRVLCFVGCKLSLLQEMLFLM